MGSLSDPDDVAGGFWAADHFLLLLPATVAAALSSHRHCTLLNQGWPISLNTCYFTAARNTPRKMSTGASGWVAGKTWPPRWHSLRQLGGWAATIVRLRTTQAAKGGTCFPAQQAPSCMAPLSQFPQALAGAAAISLPTALPSSTHSPQSPACLHLRQYACRCSKYVSEHGGHTNAYTSNESTNYHFDVNWDALEPALDRCALVGLH